jgi:Lrp/AsnC family leucine-responsive transcriptional regulator
MATGPTRHKNFPRRTRTDLDKYDMAILEVLQRDARASLQEISAGVGLSPTPCWNRIKRMESEGVIRGYSALIDQAAIGFADTVIVQLTLNSHTDSMIEDFGKALEQIPEVLEAFLVSGDYDYFVRIAVRDTRDYERLLRQRLYKIPGIRNSKSSFVLRTLKQSTAPLARLYDPRPKATPKARAAKPRAAKGGG